MTRNGEKIESECLALDFPEAHSNVYRLRIENGDDPPLRVKVSAAYVARRLYFDPHGTNQLSLYYGDPKLTEPSYEYARLYKPEDSALAARLGSGRHNPDFMARPDDRPWSERHPAALWTALAVAALVLGGVAIFGLKGAA
jgi:hypothetical protein